MTGSCMTLFCACHLITLPGRTNGLIVKHKNRKALICGESGQIETHSGEVVKDTSLHSSAHVIMTIHMLLGL